MSGRYEQGLSTGPGAQLSRDGEQAALRRMDHGVKPPSLLLFTFEVVIQ
jgi:hypothetical protein